MSDLQWYALDPIDLLLMREAKPFSPGDGSWAKGQFPPLPITVFQAMRSATEWIGDESDRDHKRNLKFVGPFLLHSPPSGKPTLWLPTPQDLLCVKSGSAPDHPGIEENPEEDLTETATQWKRTARLQPLDQENPAWKYLGFDPTFFPLSQLAPMVPPLRRDDSNSTTAVSEEQHGHNAYLRQIDNTWEHIAGRPQPWIRADALLRYLKGEVLENPVPDETDPDGSQEIQTYFHKDPWTTQVLPHIKVQPGTRQVADEEGYFTEVAIRMAPHWQLVAGISATLDAKVVRLGGEGHRAIVTPMPEPPPGWNEFEPLRSPQPGHATAYVLTPGLAEATADSELFSLIPETWKPTLRSCVGDRPLLWGGMSVFQKRNQINQSTTATSAQADKEPQAPKEVAFQPQRAFVPPGTIYRFQSGQLPPGVQSLDAPLQLLPQAGGNWLNTFQSLNYGILLWGQ